MKRIVAATLVGAAALTLAACSTPAEENSPTPTATASAPVTQVTLDVYAAASLTDVFTQLATEFEADNPGVKVTFNFAGSSDLAAQINELAPADVFASANEKQMEVASEHIVGESQIFTQNMLTIAVEEGNPMNIASLADLTNKDIVTVICAEQVPCGSAALKLFEAEGIDVSPASEEANVTDVLGKVAEGQADAGLVYVTDINRATGVQGVAIEGAAAAINKYPIAVMDTGDAADAAAKFIEFVQSAHGQEVLAAAGFLPAS
jgi:molybdate transport system substrate-binding protein